MRRIKSQSERFQGVSLVRGQRRHSQDNTRPRPDGRDPTHSRGTTAHLPSPVLVASLLGAALLSVTGCGGMVQTRLLESDTTAIGTTYFLPKRLHRLSIETTFDTVPKDADKALTEASRNAAQSQDAMKEARKALDRAKAIWEATPSGAAKDEAKKAYDQTAAAFANAKNVYETAESDRVKARDAMTTATEPQFHFNMKIEPLPLMPDERFAFVADLSHSILHDDDLTLSTTKEGLLSNVTGTSTDRTGDIIVELAKAIAMFGHAPTGPMERRAFAVPKPPPTCQPVKWSGIIDFADMPQLHRLRESILDKACLALEINDYVVNKDLEKCEVPKDRFKCPPRVVPESKKSEDDNKPISGVYYRRDLPYHVKMYYQPVASAQPNPDDLVASDVIFMPNAAPIAKVDFPTGGFVKNSYTVTFDNGMLTALHATRPSEALAFVGLPVTVAKAMMGVLTEVIQFRFNYTKSETDLTRQQAALLDEIRNLREKVDAMKTGSP